MIPFGALIILGLVFGVALTGRGRGREYVGKRRKLR